MLFRQTCFLFIPNCSLYSVCVMRNQMNHSFCLGFDKFPATSNLSVHTDKWCHSINPYCRSLVWVMFAHIYAGLHKIKDKCPKLHRVLCPAVWNVFWLEMTSAMTYSQWESKIQGRGKFRGRSHWPATEHAWLLQATIVSSGLFYFLLQTSRQTTCIASFLWATVSNRKKSRLAWGGLTYCITSHKGSIVKCSS